MIKKIIAVPLVLVLAVGLLVGLAPDHSLAAGDITVTASDAVPSFPNYLNFSVQAQSGATITDVRLHFTVERDSFVKVVTEEKPGFISGTSITTMYSWDMRQSGGLPTGTVVDYWWTVSDSAGHSLTTPQQQVTFADTRFDWQSIDQGNITLYWYSGGSSLAQTLMDTAQQGLAGLETSTGAHLSRPVSIYVYDNAADMQGAMIFAQEWTGGATYPAYSTIVIGINSSNLDWGKGALVHELTHMVNYQMTNNPYGGLPTWLDEGLAMYSEGPLDYSFESTLDNALMQGSLFSVRSMASPFSTDATLSYLEYAESYSVVDYLISTYGQARMKKLLDTFKKGSGYDDALMAVYGFDMDGLYQQWLPFATQKYLGAGVAA